MANPTIAILGASTDRDKFGNKAVRAYHQQGYDVYPVNPRAMEIEGLTAYASLKEIPVERLNRVSVYLPPSVGITLLEEIAAVGADEFWLNPGSESEELIARAAELGLSSIVACSLIDIGAQPGNL